MTNLSGQIIRAASGTGLQVGTERARGGQGIVYEAVNRQTGRRGFLKHLTWATPAERGQLIERTEFLVNARLHEFSPLFAAAPSEWFTHGDQVGHFAAAAPGRSLDDLTQEGWAPDFLGILQLALAFVHAVALLHERGWAHGDLHGSNLLVEAGPGEVLKVTLIDYDNFFHGSMPAPQNSLGQVFYLTPEQHAARDRNDFLPPDPLGERFMLCVLLHTLILLRHPAHDATADPERFKAVMTAGVWPEDPARGRKTIAGGYPPEVLNVSLQSLFRRGFSRTREDRPSPQEWEKALVEAVDLVFICPRCGSPVVLDRTKVLCPFCRQRYPGLGLVLPDGRTLPIDGGGRRIGRADLSAGSEVSRLHAIFERFGGETRVRSFGANGLFRRSAAGWERLPDNVPVPVDAGDHLRFANAVVVRLRAMC